MRWFLFITCVLGELQQFSFGFGHPSFTVDITKISQLFFACKIYNYIVSILVAVFASRNC